MNVDGTWTDKNLENGSGAAVPLDDVDPADEVGVGFLRHFGELESAIKLPRFGCRYVNRHLSRHCSVHLRFVVVADEMSMHYREELRLRGLLFIK